MTFPIVVESYEDQFSAALVGMPDVRGIGTTRSQAVSALRSEIAHRVGSGELLSVEVENQGISGLAGKYADDPSLRQICEDAYRQRDAERPA